MSEPQSPNHDSHRLIPDDLPSDISVTYAPRLLDSFGFEPSDSLMERASKETSAFNSSELGLSVWSIESAPKEKMVSVDVPSDDVFEQSISDNIQEPARREGVEYKLIRLIGSGGFGEVWEAVQASLERIVAVKKLHRRLIDDPDKSDEDRRIMNRNFKHEALTTANLDHPNILAVHDLGMDEDGSPVLAMKRVRGKPWHEILVDDFFNMSPRVFLTKHIPVLIDVCQAVAFAHSRGVVHRDIKPQQVMVGEFGEVLLMDWGLSVVVDAEALLKHNPKELDPEMFPSLTTVTNPAGTVAFMAPEQTKGTSKEIGKWTDIYLLGGVLYCLITGELPHRGKDPKAVFKKAQLGDVQPPNEAAPNRRIPPMLADLAMKAMEPDPEKRIKTVEEFKDKLNEFMSAASQREESIEMVEQAEEIFEKKKQNYSTYGDAMNKLAAAEGLWRSNPAIAPLRDKVSRAYSRLALANRDLVLARILAEDMVEGPSRTKLESQIAQVEVVIKRRIRQRNFAISIASFLFLAVITGGSYFSIQLARERDRARAERDDAETARSNAQQLVNLVVDDLQENLELVGKLEPLAAVATGVQQYFENFSPEDLTPEMAIQQVEAFKNLGLLQLKLGDTNAALELFQQYRMVSSERLASSPIKREWIRRQSDGSRLIASVLLGQGNMEGAELALKNALRVVIENDPRPGNANRTKEFIKDLEERSLAQSVSSISQIADIYPDDSSWATHIAEIYELAGRILQVQAKVTEARMAYEEELGVLRNLEAGSSISQRTLTEKRIEVLTRLATIAKEDGEFDDAYLYFQQALELARNASSNDPTDVRWTVAQATIALAVGQFYFEFERYDEALPNLQTALSANLRLVQRDSSNMVWQEHLLQVYMALAVTSRAMQGGFGDSRKFIEAALNVAIRLAAQDNANAVWSTQIVALLRNGVNWEREYLLESGTPMEASILSRIVATSRQLIEGGPHRASYLDVYFDASVWLAAELLARGNVGAANAVIGEALVVSQSVQQNAEGLGDQFLSKSKLLNSERTRLLERDSPSTPTSTAQMTEMREDIRKLGVLDREVKELEVILSMGNLGRLHEGDIHLAEAAIAAYERPEAAMEILEEALGLRLFDEKLIPVLNKPLAQLRERMPDQYDQLIDRFPILLLAERGF